MVVSVLVHVCGEPLYTCSLLTIHRFFVLVSSFLLDDDILHVFLCISSITGLLAVKTAFELFVIVAILFQK